MRFSGTCRRLFSVYLLSSVSVAWIETGRGGLPAGQGNWRIRDLAELVAERLS